MAAQTEPPAFSARILSRMFALLRKSRAMRRALLLIAVLLFVCGLGAQDQDLSKVQIKVSKVAGNVYMLQGVGGNIAASVGDDGIVEVRRRIRQRGCVPGDDLNLADGTEDRRVYQAQLMCNVVTSPGSQFSKPVPIRPEKIAPTNYS